MAQLGLHTPSPLPQKKKRHENGGVPIKIACGTKTFMLDVTFIKTVEKKGGGVLGERKNKKRQNKKTLSREEGG